MSDDITITPAEGTWVVRGGGSVLGDTESALRLAETGHDPVIYFPREDVAMAFLETSATTTTCPLKGEATYYEVVTKSTTLRDVAWSYESPKDDVAQIAGHIAFHAGALIEVERT